MVTAGAPPPAHDAIRRRGDVLVSGAGFAGLATAYWLDRLGYRVTLVEVANGLRRGGTPVDIEGEAIDVLARMGLIDAVRAKALPPRRFEFKAADDSTLGSFDARDEAEPRETKHEIHRDDLLEILADAIRGSVNLKFGTSIARLEEGADAMRVTFVDGSRGDYALVVGCDGNRSRTRRLAFGNGEDFSHFLGGYFFIKVVPATDLLPADVSQIYSTLGRTALLNGYDDRTDIALAFRSERAVAYDHRDRAWQRARIHEHFDALGWKTPAMLGHLDADDDFYFDEINQIRMPTWSKGRTVLVGDAAYCVSPVAGRGGAMAIVGAGRLAEALVRHGADYAAAFEDYRLGLHPIVSEVQERAASFGMATMFPSDEAELAERDRRLREGSMEL